MKALVTHPLVAVIGAGVGMTVALVLTLLHRGSERGPCREALIPARATMAEPDYAAGEAKWHISALADQGAAGNVMMSPGFGASPWVKLSRGSATRSSTGISGLQKFCTSHRQIDTSLRDKSRSI